MKYVIGAFALLLALTGCGGSEEPAEKEPATVEADVRVELRFPLIADALTSEEAAGQECAGALDYSEVRTRGDVTFYDAADKVIGTSKLQTPTADGNVVVCTWVAETTLETDTDFVSAEVGGWRSAPVAVKGGSVSFVLDTEEEDASGVGSKAQVDPTWTRD